MIGKLLKLIRNIILIIFLLISVIYISLWVFNIFVNEPANEEVSFGITFSRPYVDELDIDWKETYIAILDELQVKKIRISAYWNIIEKEEGVFDFTDMDFQVKEAEKRNVEIIFAVGRKLPRWPECHIPDWAKEKNNQNDLLLNYIKQTIERYKNIDAIIYWQVENEPFLPGFGDCPDFDREFLDKEIELVRSLDERQILVTDSGELGDWVRARKRGDIFGTTMYRFIWHDNLGKVQYPLPPTWFKFKKYASNIFVGENRKNDIIVIEMQAEAWGEHPIPYLTLEEQFSFMGFEEFKENISYAKKAGFPDIYLWGVEWWYWLATEKNDSRFWDYAKTLF